MSEVLAKPGNMPARIPRTILVKTPSPINFTFAQFFRICHTSMQLLIVSIRRPIAYRDRALSRNLASARPEAMGGGQGEVLGCIRLPLLFTAHSPPPWPRVAAPPKIGTRRTGVNRPFNDLGIAQSDSVE